jgi:hypothetical protein
MRRLRFGACRCLRRAWAIDHLEVSLRVRDRPELAAGQTEQPVVGAHHRPRHGVGRRMAEHDLAMGVFGGRPSSFA